MANRNYSLDILKFLLAFIIVIHHTPSPFHDFLHPLTTCAVPAFFMVSGFLIFGREINAQRILKNAWRILKIFGWSLLVYFIWYWIRHSEPYIPNVKDIVLFVFANNEPLSGHLWYLTAYAYALFLIAFLASRNKMAWFKYIAFAGLIIYFIFDCWHIYKDMPKYLTLVYCFRNWLFTAIPMMYIGLIVREKNVTTKQPILVFLLVLFAALAIIEINTFQLNHIADVYFMTIPVASTLFVLFTGMSIYKPNFLATCGEKYSLYIYIIHPIVIKLLSNVFDSNSYIWGLCSFVVTLVISILFVSIKDKTQTLINNLK